MPMLSYSVAIISHNYGRFLREAIDSVLAQSVAAERIVVIDDSSEDIPKRSQSYTKIVVSSTAGLTIVMSGSIDCTRWEC